MRGLTATEFPPLLHPYLSSYGLCECVLHVCPHSVPLFSTIQHRFSWRTRHPPFPPQNQHHPLGCTVWQPLKTRSPSAPHPPRPLVQPNIFTLAPCPYGVRRTFRRRLSAAVAASQRANHNDGDDDVAAQRQDALKPFTGSHRHGT